MAKYNEVQFNWLLQLVMCVHNVVQYMYEFVLFLLNSFLLQFFRILMVTKIYFARLVIELNHKTINTTNCTYCYPDQLFETKFCTCPCSFRLLSPPVTITLQNICQWSRRACTTSGSGFDVPFRHCHNNSCIFVGQGTEGKVLVLQDIFSRLKRLLSHVAYPSAVRVFDVLMLQRRMVVFIWYFDAKPSGGNVRIVNLAFDAQQIELGPFWW